MLNQSIIPEFKNEAASTRKMLQKVPADKLDWRPHGRSMTLGALAAHVANIPGWIPFILGNEDYDIATRGYKEAKSASTEELVENFNDKYETALKNLESAADETLLGTWTFRSGEHVIFRMPRMAAIRLLSMNHLIHHRGQLSVYLRLLEVPVPGMYGPSADEQFVRS